MFYATILLSIFISFIYWIKKNELSSFFLFWYLVFLPTTKLLPDVNIPGFRFENFFGIGFIIADFFGSKGNTTKSKLYFKQSRYVRIFLILQIVFLIYSYLKGMIFPRGEDSYSIIDFLIFSIRMSLILFIFIRVCYLFQNYSLNKVVIYGLLVGLCLLGFSSFFYKFFAALGVNTGQVQYDEELRKNVIASTGLFRGHPTQFSAFLSTGFGFAFAILISNKKYFIKSISTLAILSCLLGIINSSKREGLVGIIVIIIFYFLMDKQNISKKTVILFFVSVLGIWSIINFGDYLLLRISSTGDQLKGFNNTYSRYSIWSTHLYYFVGHPEIWPLGIWWNNSIKVGNVYLSSHSTVLKFLIYAGIPFFFFFYKNIYDLFKYYYKNKQFMSFNYLYPLIGYLIPSIMNDNYDTDYLPFMLGLGVAIYLNNKLNSIILVQKLNEEFKNQLELDQIS